jgi:predicted ATPase
LGHRATLGRRTTGKAAFHASHCAGRKCSIIRTVSHTACTAPAWVTSQEDREAAYAAAHRAVTLADKFGLPPWRASSLILVGWATANGGAATDAVRLIEAEIANATAAGPLPQYYLGLAAEVLLVAGRPADALRHLDRAIAGIDEAGIGIYLPEIYRLRGACLLALDRHNKDEARASFATAADIARCQGAVIFERRAGASLSELAT